MNKMDEITATVDLYRPDILGVTETWLRPDIADGEVALQGYELFRCDRGDGRRGGGVALYIRQDLGPSEFRPRTDYPEQAWGKIRDKRGRDHYIGVVYRSPKHDSTEHKNAEIICNLLSEMGARNMILLGDFNYGHIDWGLMRMEPGASPDTATFLDCIENNFLTQHITEPTRVASTLDLVITRDPHIIHDIAIHECLSSSDHNMISGLIDFEGSRYVQKLGYDYRRGDYEAINEELHRIDWDGYLIGDTNSRWIRFRDKISQLQKEYVPTREARKGRKKAIWMTNRALKSVDRKRKVFRKYKDSRHPAVIAQNKITRKEVTAARRNYEQKLAENIKSDTKSFYAYARNMSSSKLRPTVIQNSRGSDSVTTEETCDIFNEYFTSVFSQETMNNMPEPVAVFVGEEEDRLGSLRVNRDDVVRALKRVREDKAAGSDEMSPRIITKITDSIADPLCNIFNSSLSDGIVPDDWKRANVTPIHKNGSRLQASNYRPISLTSQLCKTMETILREKLVGHLEGLELVYDTQHGFRKGRSSLSNLLTFLDRATRILDSGQCLDVIYLDLAKAFDKVPHERLRRKLKSHGIVGEVGRWIGNWLRDRKQRVCINGKESSWRNVTSGVPQGSILGPVLFLMYINDFEVGVENEVLKFADDTKLFGVVSGKDSAMSIQRDLNKLLRWTDQSLMEFNIDKCRVMHMGNKNIEFRYKMKGCELKSVDSECDLGIEIRKDLKVSDQCTKAYNKANRVLGMIHRNIRWKTPDMMLRLYKTLVRPHVEYCTAAWSPYYKKDKDKIEKIQRRMTRMVEGMRDIEYGERLKKLGLVTLEERRNRADLVQLFKMYRGLTRPSFDSMFQLVKHDRTRGHTLKLAKHCTSLNIRHNFFSERVVDNWNRLSTHVVEAEGLNSFKSRLQKFRNSQMDLLTD